MKKKILISALVVAAAVLTMIIVLSPRRLDGPSKVALKYYEAYIAGKYSKASKYLTAGERKKYDEYAALMEAFENAADMNSASRAGIDSEILVSPAVYDEDDPDEAVVYVTVVRTVGEDTSVSTATLQMKNENGSWAVSDSVF